MDDLITALLFLPVLILPALVLIAIISSKIKASGVVKKICVATKETSAEVIDIAPPALGTDITPGRSTDSQVRLRQGPKCGAF